MASELKMELPNLFEIDTQKAKKTAEFILKNDRENMFSDFVFKLKDFLDEIEIQRQLVFMLQDEVLASHKRINESGGNSPITSDGIEKLRENTELLTGNLQMVSDVTNKFLAAHYEGFLKFREAKDERNCD